MKKKNKERLINVDEAYQNLSNILEYDDIPDIIDKLKRKCNVSFVRKNERKITPVMDIGLKMLEEVPEANCIILRQFKTEEGACFDSKDGLLEIEEGPYVSDTALNQYIPGNRKLEELWETLQKVYEETMLNDDIAEAQSYSDDTMSSVLYFEDDNEGYEGCCFIEID